MEASRYFGREIDQELIGYKSNRAGISFGVVGIVIAFLWLVSGFFIVQEGQTGVVMTFGKFSHATQPGFNWRWPYPIQAHEIVNVSQVRTVEVGYRSNVRNKLARESLMLTDDENIERSLEDETLRPDREARLHEIDGMLEDGLHKLRLLNRWIVGGAADDVFARFLGQARQEAVDHGGVVGLGHHALRG